MNPELEPKIPDVEDKDPEAEKGKLFTLKDMKGDEQFKAVEYAGQFLDELKLKDARIIALSIVGSTVKGYARSESNSEEGTPKSDLDVCIIYEDSKKNSKSILPKKDRGEGLKYKGEFDVHLLSEINMANINKEKLLQDPASVIGGLVFPVLGNVTKINGYYDLIRNEIARLSSEEKEEWVASFVEGIMHNEFVYDKIERMKLSLERESFGEISTRLLDERESFYEIRIRKLFIDEK